MKTPTTFLPNDPMLNIWLNMKNNSLLLYEENKKSGNVIQQPMHSYHCGKNLRPESSLVLSDLLFAYKRCTRIGQEHVYRTKSKCDLMRILSELLFIPQM